MQPRANINVGHSIANGYFVKAEVLMADALGFGRFVAVSAFMFFPCFLGSGEFSAGTEDYFHHPKSSIKAYCILDNCST